MRRLTLRARLTLLVVASVLPFIGFNLGSAYLGYRETRARTGRQALDLARSLAYAVDMQLRGRIAVLEVLALSPYLVQGDLHAFRGRAEMVLARQAPGATMLLLRPDGQHVMNTALPAGAPLPRAQQPDLLHRAVATGAASVSNVFIGQVLERPAVVITVPARTADGPLVLAMIPAADAFDRLLARERPGEDWAVALLDRAGVRIARVPRPEHHRGLAAPPAFLAEWQAERPAGLVEQPSAEGVPSLIAYARLPGSGWGVAVAVPTAVVTAPALREARLTLAVGLGLLALGLAMARWISLGVLRPVVDLLRLAGDADPPEARPARGLGLPEADRLAEALLAEARRRHAATAALVESERRLRLVVAELNHRAKNALATVQALALQTARGEAGADPQRFTESFTGRLQTLARAHDLLTAMSWEGAALGAVVRAGLAPWLEADAGAEQPRFVVRCPCDTALPLSAPGQVQALVMALHELATNATKHGALSVPGGRVEVSCQADPAGTTALLHWRESGGPPVHGPPARQGFGTRLLQRAIARDLGPGAEVVLRFAPAGLEAEFRFAPRAPTPALAQAPGQAPGHALGPAAA